MLRFRILATLTTVGAVALTKWSTTRAAETLSGWYLSLAFLSHFFTVTALLILFLSLFSLMPTNGEFRVKRGSLYGEIFLFISRLEGNGCFGYCRAFWQTNCVLFAACVLAVLLTSIVISAFQNPLGALIFVAVVIAFAAGIVAASIGAEKLVKEYPAFGSGTAKGIYTIVAVAGLLVLFWMSGRMAELLITVLFVAVAILVVILALLGVDFARHSEKPALRRVSRKVRGTKAFQTAELLYSGYMCPRIRVE